MSAQAAAPQLVKPPIPPELAELPQWKGLVIPFVQVTLRDGSPDFRSVHESKRRRAIEQRLCGVCGKPLGYRIVFLASSEQQVASRVYHEPALHPVCAEYSVAACAMIAGRMGAYSARTHRADGKPCSDPNCDCAGWVAHGPTRTAARPRKPWHWILTRGYAIRCDQGGAIVARADRALETRELG